MVDLQPNERGLKQWLKLRHYHRQHSGLIQESVKRIPKHSTTAGNFWKEDDFTYHVYPHKINESLLRQQEVQTRQNEGEIISRLEELRAAVVRGDFTFVQEEISAGTLEHGDIIETYSTALKCGNAEMVEIFLDAQKDILLEWKEKDGNQITALHVAAFKGHEHTVQVLLDKGHPVDCRDLKGNTPLHSACRLSPAHFRKAGAARRLLAAGADVNAAAADGRTPLHHAMRSRDLAAVHLLLKAGADLFARDALERTPYEHGARPLPGAAAAAAAAAGAGGGAQRRPADPGAEAWAAGLAAAVAAHRGPAALRRVLCFAAAKRAWAGVLGHFRRTCPVCKREAGRCRAAHDGDFGYWLLTHHRVPKG